jgi:hypothetical protein
MEYEGKVYRTREELINLLGSNLFNELISKDAFGAPEYRPEVYDGLIYSEEKFTEEGRDSVTTQA